MEEELEELEIDSENIGLFSEIAGELVKPWPEGNARITVSIDKFKNWIGNAKDLPEDERPIGWDHPIGFPLDLKGYGGRRPDTAPLYRIFERPEQALMWGLFLRSQTTAAEEGAQAQLVWEPYALKPFESAIIGEYAEHLVVEPTFVSCNNTCWL